MSFENLLHGKVTALVKDGVLQVNALQKNKLTNQQIFPAVIGVVKDSVITVQSSLDAKETNKLLQVLQTLGAKAYKNEMETLVSH